MPKFTNKTMYARGEAIPSSVRSAMTIMPPPMITDDGGFVEYDPQFVQKYEDLRHMKQRFIVYVEERIDEDAAERDNYRYEMIVRCMSCIEDMQVILAAAKHLMLIGTYQLRRGENDKLDIELENNYIEVNMTAPFENIQLDDDNAIFKPVLYDADFRRSVWIGLFESAGYRVSWGNALNIKRKQT